MVLDARYCDKLTDALIPYIGANYTAIAIDM